MFVTAQQVEDIYTDLALGNKSAPTAACCRPMTLGCPGYNNKQTTYTAYGMAYGLLNADMVCHSSQFNSSVWFLSYDTAACTIDTKFHAQLIFTYIMSARMLYYLYTHLY